EVLSGRGPIITFVHENPIHGLQHLPFDWAVREAQRLLGGQGYLSPEAFRRLSAGGRITRTDLLRALKAQVPHLVTRPPIEGRGKQVEAREVLLAHLLHGITPLPHGTLRWQVTHAKATRRFRQDLPPETRAGLLDRVREDLQITLARLGGLWTLAEWAHAHTNLDLVKAIHERLGTALRAYASGHAAAANGSRESRPPFWAAWRTAQATLTRRIAPAPGEHIDRCLEQVGIPPAARDGYRQAIQRHYAALQGPEGDAPITREEFTALWLHYEGQLLREVAPRYLGTPGTLPAIQRQCQRELEAYAVSTLWAAVLAKLGLGDPGTLEDQEAHAMEALAQRVLGVVRDGGMAIHLTEEEHLGQRVLAGLRPGELSRDGFQALERLLEMGGADTRGREEFAALRRLDPRADLVRSAQEALERDLGGIGPEGTLGEFCERLTGARLTAQMNDQMIRWCAAFLDEGLAGWPMPGRERGFYAAWRTLAERDPSFRFLGVKDARPKIRQLPPDPDDALIRILRTLGVPEARWTEYLTRHLAALPGWASMVKWR
ncbi:MAG: putative inorganic carbon transporter subunit DabA, partial [Candidatus Methylomirabilales bacterium]